MPRGVPAAGFRKTKNFYKRSGVSRSVKASVKAIIKDVPVVEFQVTTETDAQIRTKLTERFDAMMTMTEATLKGDNRALIISGPAGVGKSYGVTKLAAEYETKGHKVEIVRGFVRPTGLYKVLYENRFPHCVVIFDDSDSVFMDEIALNMLKTACDMTRSRKLHWLAETNMKDEDEERLPRSFEFEGSVIFITNYDFDYLINKGNKMSPHFEAMISRSIYLDLAMKSRRDYMVRIEQVMEEGMLKDLNLSELAGVELLNFMNKNVEQLRELSLRMVIKLANLLKMNRTNWQRLATITCFRGRT
jgi:hypothetical protein